VSIEIKNELERNFLLRQDLNVRVFPSLVLAQGDVLSPIEVDYGSHLPMLEEICGSLTE